MYFNLIKHSNYKTEYLSTLILSLLPIIFFFGSGVANSLVILLDLIFIYVLFKNKKFYIFNNYLFFFILSFWLYLIINLFYSINFDNSLLRTIGFFRFIIFIYAIQFFFREENKNYKKIILNSWSILILIISLDLIFESIFGSNILGFKSYMPGRLSGFFNQELKIGNLYSAFYLIVLSYLLYLESNKIFPTSKLNQKVYNIIKNNYFYFLILIFIVISALIGERSNLVKVLFMSIIFIFFLSNKIISKLKIFIFTFLFFLILLTSSHNYQWRYWEVFIQPIITKPIEYINKSHYGSHYKVAIEVFKNNKLTGVGLKNYRIEVTKDKYAGKLSSIHPHQIHFEILSELGILGYLFFISFMLVNLYLSIKSYFKTKNYFVLSGSLYVMAALIPILPSGSFFTSFSATFFWMNFALMTSALNSYNKKSK